MLNRWFGRIGRLAKPLLRFWLRELHDWMICRGLRLSAALWRKIYVVLVKKGLGPDSALACRLISLYHQCITGTSGSGALESPDRTLYLSYRLSNAHNTGGQASVL